MYGSDGLVMVTRRHAAGWGRTCNPLVNFYFNCCRFNCTGNSPTIGCCNVTNTQNPGYMKENFMICIESLHIADTGEQENVRVNSLTSCYELIGN